MARGEIHLPEEQHKLVSDAWRDEILSILFLITIIIALGLTMGSSQAMKALWLEDLLSIVPSTAVLIGIKSRSWQPDETFNYGYRRAVQIGFLAGSVALFGLGAFIFGDSVYKLMSAEHPSIGTVEIFGSQIWLGWLMIAALIYSCIPPAILGYLKRDVATKLHDKSLYISGTVDKGDWLSGAAGVVGILGIALGYWWTDALAGAFISYEIIKDGWEGLKNSTLQLMDMRPTDVTEKEPDPVIEKVEHTVNTLPWVLEASIRLREEGDVIMEGAIDVENESHHSYTTGVTGFAVQS